MRCCVAGGAAFLLLSSFHKDMIERLPQLNPLLAEQVRRVLEQNKAERHIRGGEATRKKYRNQGEETEK